MAIKRNNIFILKFFIFVYFSKLLFPFSQDNLCGIKSLLVIYKIFGITPDYKEINYLIRKYPDGLNMYEIYRNLKRKGLYVKGTKLSLKDLSYINLPCICYFYPEHFAVIESYKDGKFKVIDPPKTYYLTEKEISSYYSGFILLVSPDKEAIPDINRNGPDIRFKKYTYDFRKIEPGKKLTFKFKFINKGNEPLIIKNIRASCGCIVSKLQKRIFLPKEKGEIKIEFDTTGRSGWQKEYVYLYTNDPASPLILLQLQGEILTELRYTPSVIDFGVVRKEQFVQKSLYIMPGEEKFKIKSIIVPSYFKVENMKTKTPLIYEIQISFSPKKIIPKLEERIILYTNLRKYRKIEIPVIAEVNGEINCFPDFFFFGIVNDKSQPKREIIISNYFKKDFQIIEITNDIDWLTLNLQNLKNEYKLIAKLKKEKLPVGCIKGEIKVKTNLIDEPLLKIPVYVWKEK